MRFSLFDPYKLRGGSLCHCKVLDSFCGTEFAQRASECLKRGEDYLSLNNIWNVRGDEKRKILDNLGNENSLLVLVICRMISQLDYCQF